MSSLRSPQTSVTQADAPRPPVDAVAQPAPHIDIVKQGDKIMRIIITCTCGECTEIECLYPPGH